MIIRNASKDFFYWQLDPSEKALPESYDFIAQVKEKIPANSGRYYFRERKCWAINKTYFLDFMEIVIEFYQKLVFKQGEMF